MPDSGEIDVETASSDPGAEAAWKLVAALTLAQGVDVMYRIGR